MAFDILAWKYMEKVANMKQNIVRKSLEPYYFFFDPPVPVIEKTAHESTMINDPQTLWIYNLYIVENNVLS